MLLRRVGFISSATETVGWGLIRRRGFLPAAEALIVAIRQLGCKLKNDSRPVNQVNQAAPWRTQSQIISI